MRCSLLRARKALRRACRRLSSAGFPRGPRLLPIASGIHGKGPRLPRKVSWLHREKAGGFRACAQLLRGAPGNAQNRAFGEVRASWQSFGSRRFLREMLLLAMQTAVRGTSTLFDTLDRVPASATWQSFALVGAKDLFNPLEPPPRVAKIGRGMQTAF